MKTSAAIKSLLLLATFAVLTPAQANDAKIESDVIAIPAVPKDDDVVAAVGDYTFTWKELTQEVNMILMMMGDEIPADQKSNIKEMARQRILQTFIVDSLVKIAAEKENVTVDQKIREEALAAFEAEQGIPFDLALQQLSPALAKRNRQSFELRLLEMALLENVVFKDLKVDEAKLDEEMKNVASYRTEIKEKLQTCYKLLKDKTLNAQTIEDAFKAYPDLFAPQVYVEVEEPELSQLANAVDAIKATAEGDLTDILSLGSSTISIDNASIEGFFAVLKKPQSTGFDKDAAVVAAKDKIDAIKKQLDEGANFEDLAATHSACPSGANGGDLGEFSRGMMVKEFEDATFSQPINVVGEPVKTDFGYHLIKVTARDEAAGKVTASHILITPEKPSYKLVPVMAVLPVEASREEVKEILLEQMKAEAARDYFEKLRQSTPMKCTLYPNLAK